MDNVNQDTRIRALRDEDTDDIVALYDRAGAVEPGLGPVPRLEWQRFVELPQNRNGRDFRVAEHDGHLVGLAECHLKDQDGRKVRFFKIVVDPSTRRRGIASALLAELLSIDEPSDNLSLQSLSSCDWHAGIAFLKALGFAHIQSEISLLCSRLKAPSASSPVGITIDRVAEPARYAADVARIHNAAYRFDVAFRHYSPLEMLRVLENGDVWIAVDSGHVVGFCLLDPDPGMVWLDSIAIDPTHQGRGLGQALAHRALEAADIRPERPAALEVSSVNQTAIKVYQRLGFELRRERRRYSARHGQLAAFIGRHRGPSSGA